MMMNCVASVTNICGFAICDLWESEWAFETSLQLLSSFNLWQATLERRKPLPFCQPIETFL